MAQRGFIFAVHPTHGLLLLRAYKKKKGTHHQLPGGRVDADELEYEDAHRRAAARELHEETGIDVPPARLMDTAVRRKNREYFFLELRDADGAGPDRDHANAENPFTLALSGEHTGFTAAARTRSRCGSGEETAATRGSCSRPTTRSRCARRATPRASTTSRATTSSPGASGRAGTSGRRARPRDE